MGWSCVMMYEWKMDMWNIECWMVFEELLKKIVKIDEKTMNSWNRKYIMYNNRLRMESY